MSAPGSTPIILYHSVTAAAVPSAANLAVGELAINVTDSKVYTKDNGGAVIQVVGTLGAQDANAVAIIGGNINSTVIGASTAAAATVTTLTATSDSSFTSTGALKIPVGTSAQQPTGANGKIRYNTDISKYEGYSGSTWSSLGGGATGGGADEIFIENGQTVTTTYSIPSGKNAMSTGPITIDSGVTITVPSGSRWIVL